MANCRGGLDTFPDLITAIAGVLHVAEWRNFCKSIAPYIYCSPLLTGYVRLCLYVSNIGKHGIEYR